MNHFLAAYASPLTTRTLDLGFPFGEVSYTLPSKLTLAVRPRDPSPFCYDLLLVAMAGGKQVDVTGYLTWCAANGNPRALKAFTLRPEELGACRGFRLGERNEVHAYTAQGAVAGVLTQWGQPQG